MKIEKLRFGKKLNEKVWDQISHFFAGEGRICSKEEFESLDSINANPNGTITLISDDDFPLMLNNFAEVRLAKAFAESGMVRSIRGQNFILPYRKGWANKPSPYYPDFILHLADGRIAIIELKSSLGMCQDETLCKYLALRQFCHQRGYLCAMVDPDYLTFEEYFWPFPEDEITNLFHAYMEGAGGFTIEDLNRVLQDFPKKKHQEIRREIASLILMDPYICNRYCHDDPNLVNAVKTDKPIDYKLCWIS